MYVYLSLELDVLMVNPLCCLDAKIRFTYTLNEQFVYLSGGDKIESSIKLHI